MRLESKKIECTFTVNKITFREGAYSIIKATLNNHDFKDRISKKINIKGDFQVLFEGDEFEISGLYKLDNFGYYIQKIGEEKRIMPDNKKSIANFIHKRVKGLSVQKSKLLVDIVGLDIINKIKDSKEILMQNGFKEKKTDLIIETLSKEKEFHNLSIFIQSMGLPSKVTNDVFALNQNSSLSILKSNPYLLCLDDGIEFEHMEIVGKKIGIDKFDINRIKAFIVDVLKKDSKINGNVCMEYNSLMDNAISTLEISKASFFSAIKSLGEDAFVNQKAFNGIKYVYLPMLFNLEKSIIKNMKRVMGSDKVPFARKSSIEGAIKKYEDRNFELDTLQKQAVINSLTNNISVLTGGPGTGKTQTTSVIVESIFEINPMATIKLLAPTGKASDRMTELIKLDASTIHRGIKLMPFSTNQGAKNSLEEITEDFVIVDESSMIDFNLFDKLLACVSDETRVILVGDVDQLPPIGLGYVFDDLISSNIIPSTKLTKVFRQAMNSIITKNAHAISNGLTTKNGVDVSNEKDGDFFFIKKIEETDILKSIKKSVTKLIDVYNYSLNDIVILSPMKEGLVGVNEINALIQDEFNSSKKEIVIDEFKKFKLNDKVINNKNDYDLNVFNGNVGVIEDISETFNDEGVMVSTILVNFGNKEVLYQEDDFKLLDLAYAMTTHKSQGSEFKCVLIPLHKTLKSMANKNMIYTAITRARDKCILVGDIDMFNYSIDNKDISKKMSNLINELRLIS
ncbi:MAG: AAA family ATPase [Peptostreptococcaceae bacterium]